MKSRHILTPLSAVLFIFASLPTQADGPDFDANLTYIQTGLDGSLKYEGECSFHARNEGASHGGTFNASDLGVVPIAIEPRAVRFECLKGEQCIARPDGAAEDGASIDFAVLNDAHGIAYAISRLIEQCSGGI